MFVSPSLMCHKSSDQFFKRGHRRAKLNDNGDGTLSVVGEQEDGGIKPAVIVSWNPLDPNEPPMLEPVVPAGLKWRLAKESESTRKRSGAGSGMPKSTEHALVKTSTALDPIAGESGTRLWEYIHPYLKTTPFSPIPKTGHVPQMLSLPRVRDIRFNKAALSSFPYSEGRTQDVAALIMQVTGDEAPHPCRRCQEGRGPFEGCYLISVKAPLNTRQLIVSCANCFYKCNQTYCCLKDWSRQTYPELTASPYKELILPPSSAILSKKPRESASEKQHGARRSERVVLKESLADASSSTLQTAHLSTREWVENSSTRPSPSETSQQPRVEKRSARQVSMRDEVPTLTNVQAGTANPAELLELETWEIAPGRVRNEENPSIESMYSLHFQACPRFMVIPASSIYIYIYVCVCVYVCLKGNVDNYANTFSDVAFSTAYLSQGHPVMVTRDVAFQVITIKPGTTHTWKDTAHKLRLCSVAAGKVRVKMHGQEFAIGPNGMFKIGPGVDCTATNALYVDATLHINVLPSILGSG